jgi:hypothetical protein
MTTHDDGLPEYVRSQQEFYARTTRQARLGYTITEVVAIVTAAAVPVSVAAGLDDWVAAALGGLAAIATGLRQAFNFRQNWALRAAALVAIEKAIGRYEEPDAKRRALVDRVGAIAIAETTHWQGSVSRVTDVSRPSPPAPGPE